MSVGSETVEIYLSFAKGSKKTDSQIILFYNCAVEGTYPFFPRVDPVRNLENMPSE